MINGNTKRVPNSLIENTKLKEKSKALLYYLYAKANLDNGKSIFKVCKTEYKEILDVLNITIDKNYKRKAKKLLTDLESESYIDYREDIKGNLVIEVLIDTPIKNFTRMPYSVVNNKNIDLNLVPCYMAILKHDFMKGECNPSIPTIAKYTGASIRSCHERIDKLEDRENKYNNGKFKLLEVERTKGGTKVTNTFRTSNGTNFYYELIEVEPRFEYTLLEEVEEPKKENKPLVATNTKEVCLVNVWEGLEESKEEKAL